MPIPILSMIAEFLEYEFDGKMKIDAQAFA